MSGSNSAVTRPFSVGVLGGTFNPVHIGHLRSALEIRQHLQLDEMRLMPCALPPHREAPETGAQHRLAMLQAATDGEPALSVDDRELRRAALNGDRPSYTFDSAVELRNELGPEASICLCVGMDSLLQLHRWHRWQELLDYVHLVVVARPGWQAPTEDPLVQWLQQHRCSSSQELLKRPSGRVWMEQLTLLPVSSTDIRRALAAGESVSYLLPEAVIGYINKHQLYQ
ncbi:MAG: nicotinate-nucleotide adenylyltransferase [Porticoccaceae bacterium]|nr:nicotinate-nucleotide adenylyltransferase [Porticoccaceae bacterium]